MFGVTTTTGDPTGGLYGAGRFGYSLNEVSAAATATLGTFASSSVNFDSTMTGTAPTAGTASAFSVLQIPTSSLTALDELAVRSFTVSTGSGTIVSYPAFTKIVGGNVEFIVSGSVGPVVAGPYTVKYSKTTN